MQNIQVLTKPILAVGVLAGVVWFSYSVGWRHTAATPRTGGASAHAVRLRGIAPVFIENRGQLDGNAPYYIQRAGGTVQFASNGITFEMASSPRGKGGVMPVAASREKGSSALMIRTGLQLNPDPLRVEHLQLDFIGTDGRKPIAAEPRITKMSYLSGPKEDWVTQVPTFGRLTYSDLWPGVDMDCSNDATHFKYTYRIRPGASPRQIRHAWRGANAVRVSESGEMEVGTALGMLRDQKPFAYQNVDGRRVEIAAEYELTGEEYGFKVGSYNPALPLFIDPSIEYAGYWGDAFEQQGLGIAVDSTGAAYLTGYSFTSKYNSLDAYVVKVDPTGQFIVYSTYIGGSGDDGGFDIAVDSTGSAYITGFTSSGTAFPAVGGPDLTYNLGPYDAFVCKLDPIANPVYCGFLGGANAEWGEGIVVDSAGNAYVTGPTNSTEATFPVKVGPDLTFNGQFDTFIAKVKAVPTDPVPQNNYFYAGYIGGSGNDAGLFNNNGGTCMPSTHHFCILTAGHVQVDASGNAYISGMTDSDEKSFPNGNGFGAVPGFNQTHSSGYDAFIVKVNPAGTGFVYATFIGGTGEDFGQGMAVDAAGNAHITGYTSSRESTFPSGRGFGTIPGFDRKFNGSYDAFAVKLNASGTGLLYATYLGGPGKDQGFGVQLDSSGNLIVAGLAHAGFPVFGGPDLTFNSVSVKGGTPADGFVTKLDPTGTNLIYSSYIGGAGDDICYWVAVDANGNAYVAGSTTSDQTTFPNGNGMASIPTFGGQYHDMADAFIVKISP